MDQNWNSCPATDWKRGDLASMGFDPEKLEGAKRWIAGASGSKAYRAVIVRKGRIVAEWIDGMDRLENAMIFSAVKSVYGNILGIAIEEGMLRDADEKVVDYFPSMMDVPEGFGPKPGRYAEEKDRDITFRHLISNTSGYMKPGELPGGVFHYQTFGMNIFAHALATLYGYYDPDDPEGSPGIAKLIEEKIASPIGASFTYALRNFDHPPEAKTGIFGYFTIIETNPYDAARLGLLWQSRGVWNGQRIIPEAWFDESIRANEDIKRACHEDMWKYGYGFWTNEYGKLFDGWDSLPKSAYSACGAAGHFITVFPDSDLIVVQNPGPFRFAGRANPEFLRLVYDAITD